MEGRKENEREEKNGELWCVFLEEAKGLFIERWGGLFRMLP